MSTPIHPATETRLLVARVPCGLAGNMIDRLREAGVWAIYSIRDHQLHIYFADQDRAAVQQAIDLGTTGPSDSPGAGTSAGWVKQILVGQHF